MVTPAVLTSSDSTLIRIPSRAVPNNAGPASGFRTVLPENDGDLCTKNMVWVGMSCWLWMGMSHWPADALLFREQHRQSAKQDPLECLAQEWDLFSLRHCDVTLVFNKEPP